MEKSKKDKVVATTVKNGNGVSNGVGKTKDLKVVHETPAVTVSPTVPVPSPSVPYVQKASATLNPSPNQAFEPETIQMNSDDANSVKTFEQQILQLKIQLSDLEVQITDANAKKAELVTAIKTQSANMFSAIRGIAQAHGIDPDGKADSKKWTLNTQSMLFQRTA
jgi:hypothetical protein